MINTQNLMRIVYVIACIFQIRVVDKQSIDLVGEVLLPPLGSEVEVVWLSSVELRRSQVRLR